MYSLQFAPTIGPGVRKSAVCFFFQKPKHLNNKNTCKNLIFNLISNNQLSPFKMSEYDRVKKGKLLLKGEKPK